MPTAASPRRGTRSSDDRFLRSVPPKDRDRDVLRWRDRRRGLRVARGEAPPAVTQPPITERQHRVLEFVRDFRARRGLAPTLEEIAKFLGVHRVTVFGHVRELIRKGYLRKTGRVSRS